MEKMAEKILKHAKSVICIFACLCLLSIFGSMQVKVRYDLSAYLPAESNSTAGLKVLSEEFKDSIPNLNIVVKVADLSEALNFKRKLAAVEGIEELRFLDDVADIALPLDLQDPALVANYRHNDYARFEAVAVSDNFGSYIRNLRKQLEPYEVHLSGQAVDLASANSAVADEVKQILLFAVPFALGILLLSSSGYLEPVLFMLTIFAAVLLNMGTNFLRGEISFITQSISGVMQLAVSMDYAIFLLHQYKFEKRHAATEPALVQAMIKSFSAITASAVTTFFGFIVLVFMSFTLGLDMGLVLAKGVFFSLFSVLTLLPCLIKVTAPYLERFSYQPFLTAERFRFTVTFGAKVRYLYLLIVIVLIPVIYLAQKQAHITYGMGNLPQGSVEAEDARLIEKEFGKSLLYVLLLEDEDFPHEQALTAKIATLKDAAAVISYSARVGADVPAKVLPPSLVGQLISPHYRRIIIQAGLKSDSPEAFALAAGIRRLASEHLSKPFYTVGEAFSLYDMKLMIEKDNILINRLIIISVALVLLLTFKNLLLPFLLLLTIEFSIWLNLGIPYFTDTSLNFIGYLVINTFQLGATIDYGILLSEKYLHARKSLNYERKQAFRYAICDAGASLLPPALILSGCGFILYFISSIYAVKEIGLVLGRGALLSLFNVLILLPNLLYLCDKAIMRTFFKLPHCHARAAKLHCNPRNGE